ETTSLRAQQLHLEPARADWPVGGVTVRDGPMVLSQPAALPDTGGAVIAWTDLRSDTDADIYAQRLTAAGALDGGWPAGGVAVATGSHHQSAPGLSSDGAGGTIVTWADPPSGLRVAAASLARAGSHNLPTLRESHAKPGRPHLIRIAAAA